MNSKVLRVLEYNKIIEQLVTHATSELGKEYCKKLEPSSDINEITMWQQETKDALTQLYKKGSLSFSGVKDIRGLLMSLDIGKALNTTELLSISAMLNVCLRAKSYSKEKDNPSSEETTDSLSERFSLLEPLSPLNNEIKRCIISEDTISDDASPELKNIRRSMKITNDRIHEHLTNLINSQGSKNILQDNIITMRNGRYCIPVKAEHKNTIQGMVHDQSSSGSTFFIEPATVVKYNNELSELYSKEQTEIEKILATLSNMTAEYKDILKSNMYLLSELDFIFAKAALAKDMKASIPDLNTNKVINIKKGRHPLINPKNVVPIDIKIGNDYNQLIITGPNTGGKTVSLKTAGLLTLMGQSGLHIPAQDNSEIAIFDEIYADIGDEQSIEQSLSTFSSHMTNTISILENVTDNSFVLFDELGAGTDPTEGAALAMSILSYLHNLGVTTMATTHYSEIKIFALETKGIENACCEFDVNTLRPTYRLLIGIPGKSNAFAISGKLGLPEHIIDKAKTYIDGSQKKFEDVITELETSRLSIENERQQLKMQLEEAEKLKAEYQQKTKKLDDQKQKIIEKAKDDATALLQEAKDYADETIRTYNKLKSSSGNIKDMENARSNINKKLKENQPKNNTLKAPVKQHKPKDFKLGDTVKILSMGCTGSVTSLPNSKGELTVQAGIFNTRVNISDLVIVDEEVITSNTFKKTSGGKIKMSKSSNISTEINVIGKTVDEALSIVEKYLDDAYLAHLPQVRIIHGRGTGALRNAIAQKLKKTKYVKEFHAGAFGEGDMGVTVVIFK
ncbi:MAG: endonuclease MutS2 [Lachnospiraceae bacterium]|nr:endonuclease MutS2 [Lachnospiraceae bacterium]